mmetsp:Transcript_21418/g.30682  ORF Transcript_21418/g.30682 Transcript_21418/m.30682 type:complete len:330 (-) Transcript_21418:662-1651(-)
MSGDAISDTSFVSNILLTLKSAHTIENTNNNLLEPEITLNTNSSQIRGVKTKGLKDVSGPSKINSQTEQKQLNKRKRPKKNSVMAPPKYDPRVEYINRFADLFNKADFEYLSGFIQDIFIPDCVIYHDCVGTTSCSLFPCKLKISGTKAAIRYYTLSMQCLPDIVISVVDNTIRLSESRCSVNALLKFDGTLTWSIDIINSSTGDNTIHPFSLHSKKNEDDTISNKNHNLVHQAHKNNNYEGFDDIDRIDIDDNSKIRLRALLPADPPSSNSSNDNSSSTSSHEIIPIHMISNHNYKLLPKLQGTIAVQMDLNSQDKISTMRLIYTIDA